MPPSPRRPSFLAPLAGEQSVGTPAFLRNAAVRKEIRVAFPAAPDEEMLESPPEAVVVPVQYSPETSTIEPVAPLSEARPGAPRTAVPAPYASAPVAPPTEMLARLASAIDQLEQRSLETDANLIQDSVELGIDVARRIVQSELAINPERVFAAVREAVSSVGESKTYDIHLNPDDLEVVRAARSESPLPHGAGIVVRLHSDPELSRGDCQVESENGFAEATLEGRLQRVREALLSAPFEELAP